MADPRADLRRRIETLEEAYEFFLAYAALGVSGASGEGPSGQVRDFLARAEEATAGLPEALRAVAETEALEPADVWREMADVLERDARAAGAAFRLVSSRPSVSSQLVDNLNAGIHVRALLTDLFLLDEALGG